MEAGVEIPCNSRNGMFGSEDNDNREEIGDRAEAEDGGGKEISVRGEEKMETGYNKDKPPEDDCCPICFGEFKVPCKANCGHWFCGNCILQLWKYRSRPRRCKCPFCSSAISKLTPEKTSSAVSSTEQEIAEVLQEIEQYNHFYVKGIRCFYLMLGFYVRKHGPHLHLYMWRLLRAFLMVFITMPSFVKRVFVDLIRHPERIGRNYQRVRLIAVSFVYLMKVYCESFVDPLPGVLPPGHLRLKITKIRVGIDCASVILVVLPYILVMCKTWIHIWWLRFRLWQLRREADALRAQNAALREQEAALRARNEGLQAHNAALREGEAALEAQQKAVLEENTLLLEQANASLQAEAEADSSLQGESEAGSKAEADLIKASPKAESARQMECDAYSLAQDIETSQETVKIEDGTHLQAQGTTASPEAENGQESKDVTLLQGKDINASREGERGGQADDEQVI